MEGGERMNDKEYYKRENVYRSSVIEVVRK